MALTGMVREGQPSNSATGTGAGMEQPPTAATIVFVAHVLGHCQILKVTVLALRPQKNAANARLRRRQEATWPQTPPGGVPTHWG